ncbi:MAG: hypothetical protein FWC66_00875 [Oscillospiraceae bacterium]|nr:hypothetical protein [Oscillospiraceae bacterium]
MAEDITDLTENEEPKTKQKKPLKEKKKKEQKIPKTKKEGLGETSNGKRLSLKGKLIIFGILAIVLIIVMLGTLMWFNLFGVRDMTGAFLYEPIIAVAVWFNSELTTLEEKLQIASDQRESALDIRESELSRRAQELTAREEEIAVRELGLDNRSTALDRREEQLNDLLDTSIPIFRREMTDEQREDMLSLSNTLAQMSPDDAAHILVELPEAIDAAVVLFFMAERNAGAILAEMEPEFAADIIQILLGN